jgi:hypothetical protein
MLPGAASVAAGMSVLARRSSYRPESQKDPITKAVHLSPITSAPPAIEHRIPAKDFGFIRLALDSVQ